MEMTYPARYSKSIGTLKEKLNTSSEIAYKMMLMTAMLMDLHPEDDEVVDIILKDCGVTR